MKNIKRTFLQCLFWILVWITMSIGERDLIRFLSNKSAILIFQVVLIILLNYILIPKFLYTKKYTWFIVSSLLFLILFTAVGTGIIEFGRRDFDFHMHPKGPSPFFIHFLLLSLSSIATTTIELFLFLREKEQALLRSKNENLITELKLLKAQINPHFLFNSLNNIYAFSAINTEKTQLSISYLSNMLRYVLYECEQPLVPIKNEISYIEDYIRLYKLKSSKNYPISTSFEIDDYGLKIAPMLLIPFIENAFKHSNIEKIENTYIKIAITSNENSINFTVENTFSEFKTTKDTVGGIGIKNVEKRLAILYANNHTFTLQKKDNVFSVQLKLTSNV